MASSTTALGTGRFLAGIERLCGASLDERALLERLAERLRGAVPCDAFALLRTDPATVLPTGGMVDALPPALCRHFWDNEVLEDDVNRFVELSRAQSTAAILSEATGGDLSRSRRYVTMYRDLGLGDELRVSFTARDGSCWAVAMFVREAGRLFSPEERDLLAAASPLVAEAMRAAVVATPPSRPPQTMPALVILDAAGDIASVTPLARRWMADLEHSSATGMGPVPEAVYLVAARARATAAGISDDPAWAQVRTTEGVWLRLHASCMEGAATPPGAVGVVIAPAQAPDLAPLIALAYRLTAREQEALQYLARGLTTAEAAQHMGISPHTFRDHVKALFHKVGVRSRGELVARIFAEHYLDRLTADATGG